MSLFSIQFLIFLTVVFAVYYAIPEKYRYLWMLAASYVFYISGNARFAAALLGVTAVTYAVIRWMESSEKYKKLALGIGTVAVIALWTLSRIAGWWIVGLSFFSLEAIGYMADVCLGKTRAEKNIAKYALFLAFFPTVLSGPIERGEHFFAQLNEKHSFCYDKIKKGILQLSRGYFLKLLIANRLSCIVDPLFENYAEQTGAAMLAAVIFYGIQLYADFAGYSCIVLGAGELFGYSLTENFRQPYFATGIRDFWSRWHISLSSWLRDYVYIPLGGNRKGRCRQYLNVFVTFLVSGIWHGAGINFIVWGALHGLYQVLSRCTVRVRDKIKTVLHVRTDCFSYRLFQMLLTFAMADFAWLFFRSPSLTCAGDILKNICSNFQLWKTLAGQSYLAGYDMGRFLLLLAELSVVLLIDILHERHHSISRWLAKQNALFRWMVYLTIAVIMIFGILHDYGLDASNFIYTRF